MYKVRLISTRYISFLALPNQIPQIATYEKPLRIYSKLTSMLIKLSVHVSTRSRALIRVYSTCGLYLQTTLSSGDHVLQQTVKCFVGCGPRDAHYANIGDKLLHVQCDTNLQSLCRQALRRLLKFSVDIHRDYLLNFR